MYELPLEDAGTLLLTVEALRRELEQVQRDLDILHDSGMLRCIPARERALLALRYFAAPQLPILMAGNQCGVVPHLRGEGVLLILGITADAGVSTDPQSGGLLLPDVNELCDTITHMQDGKILAR